MPSIVRLASALFFVAAVLVAQEGSRSQAVVVDPKGSLTLKASEVVGEDGVHLVFFSDREDANWKMIQPGETRLMLMLHMSVGAGTHSVGGFEVAELEALFDMGKGEPEHAITAYLVTNTGDEAVRFKLNKAEQRCFAHAGAVTVHGEPQFKRALSADFAFVFDDRQVAGHVRFSK